MTNLTEQDLKTIELIDERLKRIEDIIYFPMQPINQPTAKDEVEEPTPKITEESNIEFDPNTFPEFTEYELPDDAVINIELNGHNF